MKKEIYVNVERSETRVAVLEDGKLAEIFIQRETSQGAAGNIYKGRVGKVLPGIQSAFVAVGLERDTFLHVSDVIANHRVYRDYLTPGKRTFRAGRVPDNARIEEYVRHGQELLVQIAKERVGTKGARVTTRIALPGRYLAYMPGTGILGISRRVDDRRERSRLRRVVGQNRQPSDGFVIRTAAKSASDNDLRDDINNLIKLWEDIKQRARSSRPETLLHTDTDPLVKAMRDYLSKDVTKIVVDSQRSREQVVDYLHHFSPNWKGSLLLHDEMLPLFEKYGIEQEIQKSLESKVWLSSGGHIVINQTEALVAIDVNTGRFVGSKNLEDTVFQLNMVAVKEVVRQIRLRDLGGIIVIDFIDMENFKNRRRVLQAFRDELRLDRAQSKILQISDFGLVEMTRKRSRANLQRMLCSSCPYCDGSGRIKNEHTISYEIRRRILRLAKKLNGERILIKGHPDILKELRTQDGYLKDLEEATQKFIVLQNESTYHHEQYDVVGVRS